MKSCIFKAKLLLLKKGLQTTRPDIIR